MDRSFLPVKVGLRVAAISVLALLAVLAYLPAQFLPLISDDYIQIYLARQFGPASGWGDLWNDALYRSRSTSLVLTYWTDRLFGVDIAFTLSSLFLHTLNVCLVLALGVWKKIGFRVAAGAAAFFAVVEGHQEAVIWYAALPELLVFTFVLLSFICWINFLQSGLSRTRWYALALTFFGLALLSKESAVALLGLQLLSIAVERGDWRRRIAWFAPFLIGGAMYFASIYAARSGHLHFNDGTFALNAPFIRTTLISTMRLFWFWGFLALCFLAWRRRLPELKIVAIAFSWILITFGPYVFLTYMARVPSRHTYLASTGLALIVSTAMLAVWKRSPRSAMLLSALMLAHNCGYLWLYKQRQFAERAAPTEALLDYARHNNGVISLHCFPYDIHVARYALEIKLNRSLDSVLAAPSSARCRSYWFSTRTGVRTASASD